MENILHLYSLGYDSSNPVICFDERPCQLIGDLIVPIAMKEGSVRKEDYSYQRNGMCCLLVALEPLTGRRFVKVTQTKTRKDYAEFMQELSKAYKNAKKITLVQDNLNTHSGASFYGVFKPEKAFNLQQRFDFCYTPKKASWLNMVEIELSVISRQCLNRRIATKEELEKEVLALTRKRNRLKSKVNWQFSKENARQKLKKHYDKILTKN